MRALCLTLCLAVTSSIAATAALANARVTILMDVLQVDQLVDVLRSEGFENAQGLGDDMLQGRGGAFWMAQVRQIYDTDRIAEVLRTALATGLTPEEIDALIAYFGSETGLRITALEIAARRAIADPEVEEAARTEAAARATEDDPAVALISDFIRVNDLVERNLSGAMSANMHFYLGLSDGGLTEASEAEIIADVWAQQEDIRRDTEDWLFAYLLMAYEPLPGAELHDHVTFSQTAAGQALNAALFDGFDSVYRDVSYALGRAVALNAQGDEI